MTTKKMQPSEIPEVVAFEESRDRLLKFVKKNQRVFDQVAPYVEDFNDKLEAASKAVSSRGVNCGDFVKIGDAVTYDADKLYELVGKPEFLRVGGSVATRQVLSLDKKKMELAVANGSVDPNVVDEVRKVVSRYKKPKPVVLP